MEKTFKYTVAGHTFTVCLPDGFSEQEHLAPYKPFTDASDSQPLFSLRLQKVESLKSVLPAKVLQCLNDEPPYFWILEKENGDYVFAFSYTRSHPDCLLVPSSDFKENTVYVSELYADRFAEFALSNAMMLLYTFCTSPYQTLMVHASVISHNGGGYMFLGKSGTGKSTHSRLWLEHINDTELLNDDNPVIRVVDGKAIVYGTPWSGKTPCYKNQSLPLKAVVRLSQAPYNKITMFAPLQAFASLMPACSCMRWDGPSVSSLHKTVEQVVSMVPGFHLECLPDEQAAKVCHESVTKTR